MIRFILLLVVVSAFLGACKSTSTATVAVPPSVDVESIPAEKNDVRSVAVGEPQNNSAVGVIISSSLGGEPGLYISKQMDIQAEDIGKTELDGARIVRVGEGIKITFDGTVMFSRNSSTLSEISKRSLQRVAQALSKYKNTRLVIEGHTDGGGSEKHNKSLSNRRAEAVSKYLVSHNVDPRRITTTGYGEQQPLFSNNTEKGRIQNRRVELVIIADEQLRDEARNKHP